MPNYSKATLARIGRLMSAGEVGDPPALVMLAKSGAFGRKAIYNWSLPESDPQHRKMPRIAKRMIAMLAYFSAAGLLNDKRLEEIVALETLFENEKDTAVILRRFKRVIGVKGHKAEGKGRQDASAAGAMRAGAPADHGDPDNEDPDDLDDADDHEPALGADHHPDEDGAPRHAG